jgi:hypothetical protein
MSWYRYLPCILPLAGLILVTAVLAQPLGMPAPPAPAGPVDDPEAIRSLDQTMEALGPARVRWLEYGIRQKVRLPGLAFEAEGTCLRAPDNRLRMEVRTHVGGATGLLLMVSDGLHVWQASRAGDRPWAKVTRFSLQEVFEMIHNTGLPRLREEFFEGPTLAGIGPLVHTLRGSLVWVEQKVVRGPEGDRVELTGVWPQIRLKEVVAEDKPWPAVLPRRCVLWLDRTTHWPHRVEWWGPPVAGGKDEPLAELEFRDPVFNRPVPPERCASAFSFDPGEAEIEDRTGEVTARLAQRAQQLATEARSRP